jgi:enamine deaminase RidA (YjgF/YER057c/UK114 family)
MTVRYFNCDAVAAPFGNYSHAVIVPPGASTVHLAGQVGVRADGSIPRDAGEQTRIIFENMSKVLEQARFTFANIIKMNYFVVDEADLMAIRGIRDSFIQPPYPAASLVLVKALGRSEWRVEIECIAAGVEPPQ